MSALTNAATHKNGTAAIKKRMKYFIGIGIISLIAGFSMIMLHVRPPIIPVMLVSIGSSFLAVFISTRGGSAICDEMVRRADVMSGYYTSLTTLYFLFACGIINFFTPLPMSISVFMLTMILFMSFTFMGIRFYLLRRGMSE